jgi:hypothetical protein
VGVIAALTASACEGTVDSIDPVIPEEEAFFDERLLGVWLDGDGDAYLVITPAGEGSYAIHLPGDTDSARFEGRLGQLAGRTLLELTSAIQVGRFLRPSFLLLDVQFRGDTLGLFNLRGDSLLAAIHRGEVALDFDAEGDDDLLIRSRTPAVRAALAPYIAREEVWSEYTTLTRAPQGFVDPTRTVPVPCFEAVPWREADQLFRRDPHWVGGDAASAVDLGGGRSLWLFGRTRIDPTGKQNPDSTREIVNSVGVQTGTDPSTARMQFFWGTKDGEPARFLDTDLGFGDGILVGEKLVLFLGRATMAARFDQFGHNRAKWGAWMVENPRDDPRSWRVRELETPPNAMGIALGYGGVFVRDSFVYAFGSQNPVRSQPVFMVRWSTADVEQGNLGSPEWWAGKGDWVADSSRTPRWPLFQDGSTVMSLHFDPGTRRYVAIHAQGPAGHDFVARAAPRPEGPWSDGRPLYRPTESYTTGRLVHGARAQPRLGGTQLVVTYNTSSAPDADGNTKAGEPRFVRLTRCD